MGRILRGEILWADLNPTIGHEQGGLRPVLVVSHEIFNSKSGTVIAIALTSLNVQDFHSPLSLKIPNYPKNPGLK